MIYNCLMGGKMFARCFLKQKYIITLITCFSSLQNIAAADTRDFSTTGSLLVEDKSNNVADSNTDNPGTIPPPPPVAITTIVFGGIFLLGPALIGYVLATNSTKTKCDRPSYDDNERETCEKKKSREFSQAFALMAVGFGVGIPLTIIGGKTLRPYMEYKEKYLMRLNIEPNYQQAVVNCKTTGQFFPKISLSMDL